MIGTCMSYPSIVQNVAAYLYCYGVSTDMILTYCWWFARNILYSEQQEFQDFFFYFNPINCNRRFQGHIPQMVQELTIQNSWQKKTFCSCYKWSDQVTMLHISWQFSCHGMCKIVAWLENNKIRAEFSQDFNYTLINSLWNDSLIYY